MMSRTTLSDLVMRTYEISDNIGKSAKGLVSLRILEKLFVKKIWNSDDTTSEAHPKIRCEDVLKQILEEIPISDLKMGGPEMLEWDVQSFVMHKRSRFPECTSLQLKEKFVEGSHPCFAPLKERSGMPSWNQSENIISADREIQENSARKPLAPIGNLSTWNQYANDICIEDTKETHEEGAIIPPTPNENLVSSSQGNGHSQCKILPAKNLLPAKRSKPASSADIQGVKCTVEETMAENACYPCTEGTKKHKQDVICLVDKIGEHIAQDIEKEGYSFEKESTAGDLLATKPPKDYNNMHTALKNLRKSCDNRHAVQLHHSDTEVPQRTNAKEDTNSFQNICVGAASEETAHDALRNENGFTQHLIQLDSLSNEAEVKFQHYLSQDSSKGGPTNEVRHNIEHNPEAESYSDTDGYHEEKIDIAKKKSAFLSSQCTNSQDSFATADSKELNLCVKCNKDGKLLVCSSETCPVVVHDSCLGSVPILDKAGGFYCPFCAYSQAISKYLEVKKKVPHARNDLKSFFGLGIKQSSKHLSPRSGKLRQNQPQQDDESSENDVTISNSSSNKQASQPLYFTPLIKAKEAPLYRRRGGNIEGGCAEILSTHDQSISWRNILEFGGYYSFPFKVVLSTSKINGTAFAKETQKRHEQLDH